MNDFITEAWLRANHTLSEGGEIHLPADARLTPSARELLESRHLRVKFLDPGGGKRSAGGLPCGWGQEHRSDGVAAN